MNRVKLIDGLARGGYTVKKTIAGLKALGVAFYKAGKTAKEFEKVAIILVDAE